ncbi:hypothetical protein UR09_02355 [Candidatus Nitromaritima sp. SCGC AAA799-A02]|nr:hypothetical protein UZ36_03390 [Candidatus Nitromaritima sp. SCGC AAA799-C22]KMP11833.1 hypothetical protein UR09_02355 [Candidatus Nitromaritima sp. SCGC AAA799-A02]
MTLNLKPCKEGIQFSAAIQPRSSKNEICGLHGDALKIRLTSPPVDGEANKMCVKFLAKVLQVSPSRITIASGLTGRKKMIRVEGMDPSEFLAKIPSAEGND